ncbi:MAG: helix-turn-helix domain-containing protein [Lachnospiraceae bacterium]|nr:helix-turn-helix domain-containing protein [Lachnospiraceae bacterium]
MSFGTNLERIRKDKKVSQAKLGEALGLTQQMVSSYEKETSSPNIEVLIKIADYFSVSIDTLVGHVVKAPEANTPRARLTRYFEKLNDVDREKCLAIVQTIVQDRDMARDMK